MEDTRRLARTANVRVFVSSLLVFLLVLVAVACSESSSAPPVSAPTEAPTTIAPAEVVQEQAIQPEYRPTFGALSRRLDDEVLRGSLGDLFATYTIRSDALGFYIEFLIGTGGNIWAVSGVDVNHAVEARRLVQEASFLLEKGRLPDESSFRRSAWPPEFVEQVRADVLERLEAALLELEQGIDSSVTDEQRTTTWIQGSDMPEEVNNGGTVMDLVAEHEYLRDCLYDASDAIQGVLEDLPSAIPD